MYLGPSLNIGETLTIFKDEGKKPVVSDLSMISVSTGGIMWRRYFNMLTGRKSMEQDLFFNEGTVACTSTEVTEAKKKERG